ncbi:Fic family protein [Yersinia massiliensis]|uniref:Fic family protein n=1 Tax=Yersinia massiliensis TaxID=419257 RepID=UPI0005E15802|nr:Fic family protein [Yersinia massiliensis]CNH29220.1 Fic family protein [Yersinia massiliensis]
MQENLWVWQHKKWPHFYWDDTLVQPQLRHARFKLGQLLGENRGNTSAENASKTLDVLLANIVASSEIENEQLNVRSVRSSLAKKLGMTLGASDPTSDRSDGLADIMLDAINECHADLTLERLYQWHEWLFPNDSWALNPIKAGQLRGNEPMQVVSGRMGKERIHFEAPPRDVLSVELEQFIDWFNVSHLDNAVDPLIRAAMAHFWFVTLHPFEDGNGRITRALTDMALSQVDRQSIHLYAMSVAILENREGYYAILEKCQRGSLDITPWLVWFVTTLEQSLDQASEGIRATLAKNRFWLKHNGTGLRVEQIKVLNRLLDGGGNGFVLGISASQYQKVAKVSKATATRHLAELLAQECIEKLPGEGRSTRYRVIFPD